MDKSSSAKWAVISKDLPACTAGKCYERPFLCSFDLYKLLFNMLVIAVKTRAILSNRSLNRRTASELSLAMSF